MSKTVPVIFGEEFFWAYDVALGVLLKHLIDIAEPYTAHSGREWLDESISDWRVNAVLGGDFAFNIEESWSSEQREFVIDLIDQACRQLANRPPISAQEAQSWKILDGEGVFARGAEYVETGPVVELGRAIIALATGTLEAPPAYTRWYYGCPDGRTTIANRNP